MVHTITRRGAFRAAGVFGAAGICGAAGALASCGAPGAGPDQHSYTGEATVEAYETSAGTFEAATRTTPPKNVPQPVKPENLNEQSIAGFHASLAFIAASMQYMFATGDTALYDENALSDEEKQYVHSASNEQILARMREGQNWYENPRVSITLNTPQPVTDGEKYAWEGKFTMSFGSYRVDRGQVSELTERQKNISEDMMFTGTYSDGKWHININSKTVASQTVTPTP